MSIRLNCLGVVKVPRLPQLGQRSGSSSLSRRKRLLQEVHSTRGSVNEARCPEASHTWGARITEESRPTMSSRVETIARHQASRTLRSNSTPSGP